MEYHLLVLTLFVKPGVAIEPLKNEGLQNVSLTSGEVDTRKSGLGQPDAPKSGIKSR